MRGRDGIGKPDRLVHLVALCFVSLLAAVAPLDVTSAYTLQVLHEFSGGVSDGSTPYSNVLLDAAGDLYGTTFTGGTADLGTVFKVAPDGTETVLYSFPGGTHGEYPRSGLVFDKSGNLIGTTEYGGTSNNGTVFQLSPDGTETILYSFKGGSDGANPEYSDLLADNSGNFYGTTIAGGAANMGTIFKLASNGAESVLYAFNGVGDGPAGGLILDKKGNLYGTTFLGGDSNCQYLGCGIVYRLNTDESLTVLHTFEGLPQRDGSEPFGTLVADRDGNLYGTASQGGTANDEWQSGCGVVFKIAVNGAETVLYLFSGGKDGCEPYAGLTRIGKSKFAGTTLYGGPPKDCGFASSCGVAFVVPASGGEKVIAKFATGLGSNPKDGLTADSAGNLYGTTTTGGNSNLGTVFKLLK